MSGQRTLFESTVKIPFRDDREFLHISDLYSSLCTKANEILKVPPTEISLSMIGPIYKDPYIQFYSGKLTAYPKTTKAIFSFQSQGDHYYSLISESESKTIEKYSLKSADVLKDSRFLSDQEVIYTGTPSNPMLRILSILPRLLFTKNFPQFCRDYQNQAPPLPAIKIVSQFDLNQYRLSEYTVRMDYFNSMNILKSTFLLNGKFVGCEYNKYGAVI